MATSTFNSFGGAIVTKQWEGVEPRTSPFGVELETKEGELFNMLYRYFQFDSLLEGALRIGSQPDDAHYQNEVDHIEKLKEQLAGGHVKITIKLEVEKYAR